jgi:hypothetical protein
VAMYKDQHVSTVCVARDASRVNVPSVIAVIQMCDSSAVLIVTRPRSVDIRSYTTSRLTLENDGSINVRHASAS